jgi:hypothetical protein
VWRQSKAAAGLAQDQSDLLVAPDGRKAQHRVLLLVLSVHISVGLAKFAGHLAPYRTA